ncbi:unnamed protein product [Didymodactylos carnosus]|uniref:SecA DEAD-like N-terminal domain-containing protein n=1 Tax=Didymodactylos carnosus TaxID=1234261 RepID=A0A816E5D0_9BILA|nr:unnamed protein product [Didymodactylos carnosus]CAF1643218.1 unnamed protein product [Didymodactylos carnosus]CAF3589487.1 unnamed protein product [Didymodactylos carnosus]CAF4558097.1 unnamed protein product [Didymodactylos carnosus]
MQPSQARIGFIEIIAVLVKAVEIYKGYHPRNIQLIPLALFLNSNKSDKGRLAKISTGEVTSSKILAQHDASNDPKEGYKIFFNLFGLNVNNNCDNTCDDSDTGENEHKERYLNNEIIYDKTSYFQRDILLKNFFGEKICEKVVNTVIVDEVDNMIIDNATTNIIYISHNIIDMRYLRDLSIQI